MTTELSNSAGCGGIGPAGKIHKLGTSVKGNITSSTLSTPLMTVLRPPRGFIPKIFSMPGRRRSASTRRTRLPRCANTSAEFALIVVFPSWGRALVTRTTFGGAPNADKRIEVRSARYASADSDFGREYVTREGDPDFSSKVVFKSLREWPLLESCSGIVPSAGRVEIALISSIFLTVLSKL